MYSCTCSKLLFRSVFTFYKSLPFTYFFESARLIIHKKKTFKSCNLKHLKLIFPFCVPTYRQIFFPISFHLVEKKHHPYNEQKEKRIPRCHCSWTASIWMRRKTVQNSIMCAHVTVELASKPWLVKLSLWYLFTGIWYKPVFYRLSKKV